MGRIHGARGLPLRTTPRALDVHEQLQALAADKDVPAEDYTAQMLTDDVISLLHLRRHSE
ncbi:hypothetical protein [Streptomyces cyaneofuscatus]|uniref:hypothetical protein n=1 Tax=Streptomyces cyaneofuscatus TaxID=66883 RepID=UPI002F90C5CC|nr:hypothetical protein OG973_36875 [Streptomyces cyaneofuscatus]